MRSYTTLSTHRLIAVVCVSAGCFFAAFLQAHCRGYAQPRRDEPTLIRSAANGAWSNPQTWEGGKVPAAGARVQIREGHRVVYDVNSDQPIRFIQVAGVLTFARGRDTRLDVGLIKIQPGDDASEDGFDCDHAPAALKPGQARPALEVGTPDQPIPAKYTARIRLTYFEGMDNQSCPAIVCCGGRMDFHGAPMNHTWVELGNDASKGDRLVQLAKTVSGWRVGDRVIVTASVRKYGEHGVPRGDPKALFTEERRITKISGNEITLDQPLIHDHWGSGGYRSEVANLSRNVIVESADPNGIRGHTMYHRHSAGAISYAEFRHLGKEDVLGRYAIHFHLCGTTLRGSYVVGASIWDSHNRWITVHGTQYMVVRDCVGYQSVGHGFFLEDGTEVYNVFDRNLGVQAFGGKPLPNQVIARDQNDGAAFWWANGRNTFVRNVACESNLYGFNYSSEAGRGFDTHLPILMPDGKRKIVDIRTLPFYRFDDNEAHTNGLSGMLIFANGDASPDKQHPHVVKGLTIWNTHYAFRPQVPYMLIEDLKINGATYGIYRAEVHHHVYRNIYLNRLSNRAVGFAGRADGHGRGGIQLGPFTYDGLTIENSNIRFPFVCMNMTSPKPGQTAHFKNIKIKNSKSPRNMVDIQPAERGLAGKTNNGLTYYFHDHFKKGEAVKVASTKFPHLLEDGDFHAIEGFTGKHVKAETAKEVSFPKLLDPVDDLPPATIITFPQPGMTVAFENGTLIVRGTTTDNTKTKRVIVNGVEARDIDYNFHQWEARLTDLKPGPIRLTAHAVDDNGNVERLSHVVTLAVK